KELVAHGQLPAVARRLALLAHFSPLVLAVEELVNPADGLILAPHAGELGGVQDLEELLEGGALRPEHARRIAPVEEDLHLGRQLVEERLDVEPVARAVGQERQARRHAAELAVAGGLLALGDALLHQFTRLQHLEGYEAVERREGGIAQVVAHGVGRAHARCALVLDGRDNAFALEGLARREMGTRIRGDGAIHEDVERALELSSEVLLEELPRSLGRAFDGVACFLVHPRRPLLNDDLLAGADEACTLFTYAVERGLELLFGLDTAREVAADVDGDDALAGDDAA